MAESREHLVQGSPEPESGPTSALIASLQEVAGAVTSAMSVPDLLGVVVEYAKRVTDTDKAVILLADESGQQLDKDSIVVRGRRSAHDEEWWGARLHALGAAALASGETQLEPHPEEDALLVCSPLVVRDKAIGVLAAINSIDRPFTDEQLGFIAVLSAFAATAIEQARLAELSRNVMLATERERIASEMHDGPVQSLFSVSLALEVCKGKARATQPELAERLDELQGHVGDSMTDLRRLIYELSPMRLAERGLVGAVESWLVEAAGAGSVKTTLTAPDAMPAMSAGEQACLYRAAKEAVSNAVRHARPEHVAIEITDLGGAVRLAITDDGIGFDPVLAQAQTGIGMGLPSIKRSIERAGGRLSVASSAGQGTCVTVELPIGGIVR